MHTQVVINPFLESAQMVIQQIANVTSIPGEASFKDESFIIQPILVYIGIHGELTGNILFGMEENVARHLVSKMMGGFEVTEFDEMGKSAISELGNMISGNASMLLFQEGIKVDITPPKIIYGNSYELSTNKQTSTIPLKLEEVGEIHILVDLFKKS